MQSSSLPSAGSTAYLQGSLQAEAAAATTDDITLEEAARKVGFRNYNFISGDPDTFHYFTIGCQGSASQRQRDVAELMTRIAKDPANRPEFIVITGDNFYDDGVLSPIDPAFDKYFYEMYNPLMELGIPIIVQLGNHDANRHAKAMFKKAAAKKSSYLTAPLIGKVVEKSQYMHSYLSEEDKKNAAKLHAEMQASPDKKLPLADPRKMALYMQPALHANQLPAWNMPYEAFSFSKNKERLFFLNSNTYARDYLLYQKYLANPAEFATNYPNDPIEYNQAKWFEQEHKISKDSGIRTVVHMHHTPITSGKRAFANKFDATHYLDDDNDNNRELNELKTLLGTDSESYNELLVLIHEKQAIVPSRYIGAHDHFIEVCHNKNPFSPHNVPQITVGGGGGDHHPRKSFRNHPYVTHIEGYGFADIQADFYDIYTTDGLHLRFSDENSIPKRVASFDETAEALRTQLLDECHKYFMQLKEKELLYLQEEKRIQLEAASAPASPQQATSFYSLSTLYNAASAVASAAVSTIKTVHAHLVTDPQDVAVAAVHHIYAYLNQAEPLPSAEKILQDLNEKFTADKTFDNVTVKAALEVIYKILKPVNEPLRADIPRSKSTPTFSSSGGMG